VLYEVDGHIATVTFNRPEARNAVNPEVIVRLADAWDAIDGDDDVRVAILTGTGGNFCGGGDVVSQV
jgi:enoyl-CoA hydratase